ncbi:hypothetical protein K503DRAFT_859271 [Rhizopogon vinicolor AM-OR11-026]|uniref:F-box domain-containing protein n=1 Tax=Rhizopogon vinicolor AM-OR11-026 TaxID=1314800 RepID=A0A1B7MP14_9AGAM|nr:hypothetical protein K503DRAFT_859271 [Rhizopogon vinicolor AM-OR11-026]
MGLTSKPLLPNLRELYCTEYNSDLHACVRYVLSPDLICFRLGCTLEWTNVMPSVLSGLSKHSPRLKVINLIDMPSDRITELTLRELHHLQDVWLTLVGDKAFQFRSASTLNVLRISSSTLTLIGDMAEQWVVPCKRLKLYSNVSVTALAVERALCELNNRILCDGLEEFQHDLSRIRNPIDHAFSFRTFTPLMRFSSLKVVEFAPFCMSLLDDDALGSIVKSWPRLERLYLGNRFFWEIPPRVTFQGLVTVLSSCPNLRELGLVFDATTLDLRTDEKPGGGVCNTNITKLHVGFSPIEQPQKVAIAILAILPCLTNIFLDIEPGHEMPRSLDRDVREAKWGEVTKYISFYNLIMKQEGFRV